MNYESRRKPYVEMNPVLEVINREYISLSEWEVRKNNILLKEFVDNLIAKMRLKDKLFDSLFTRVFYGGSYYDGLRVGHPNEFDLDLVLKLPKLIEAEIVSSSKLPGYVCLQLNINSFMKSKLWVEQYPGIEKLLSKDSSMWSWFIGSTYYLDNQKVRSWMESLICRNSNDLQWPIKSGPAFTFTLYNKNRGIPMDIDLVPCFEFQAAKNDPIRGNCLLVPKPIKNGDAFNSFYWRLSYQEQEKKLINDKQFLKPAIKLLKKMRDVLGHDAIASYFIKTVALWVSNNADYHWNASLSEVFMKLLKLYYLSLSQHTIPFYWNPKHNLIAHLKPSTIDNIKNRIRRVIDDIDKHLDNPYVVTRYLLTNKELSQFKKQHKDRRMEKITPFYGLLDWVQYFCKVMAIFILILYVLHLFT